MKKNFDLIVIGGGPGGHAAARSAAEYGAKVCVVEMSGWGGTCTHKGCIPTKALLSCSMRYADLKKLKRMGISAAEIKFDFGFIKRYQRQIVSISALGAAQSLKDAGVTMKNGEGIITEPNVVVYKSSTGEKETLSARNICIAWGSEPAVPKNVKLSKRVIDSDGFLNLEKLPVSVIIIGGSVIGVELATFLSEMGTAVTIIEIAATLLPHEDEEAVHIMEKELGVRGVFIHTSTTVNEIIEKDALVTIKFIKDNNIIEKSAEYVLVCTGRKPRMFFSQLDSLQIRYHAWGIQINKEMETNIPGIYAIGDVTGGMMLAHRAMQQGRALSSKLFDDGSIRCNEEAISAVIYSHPLIARVGLTQKQAEAVGMEINVVRKDYNANIMARTELLGQGFVKLLFHKNQLIGASVIGASADNLIASLCLALTGEMDLKTMSNWIIPHPSLSELLDV